MSRQNLPHQARLPSQVCDIRRDSYILVDTGGEPAPSKDMFEYFGFTVANAVKQVKAVLAADTATAARTRRVVRS